MSTHPSMQLVSLGEQLAIEIDTYACRHVT